MALSLTPRSFLQFPSMFDDEDFWPSVGTSTGSGLEISEDEKNVYIEAVVAGVPDDKVDVTYEKGIITITGRHEEEEKKDRKIIRKHEKAYSYRAAVPTEVDADKIDAEVRSGIVVVTLPKSEAIKPKKVNVKKGSVN
jgi:HSP20 family protein